MSQSIRASPKSLGIVFASDNNCVAPSKVKVSSPFVHTAPSAIARSPPIEIAGSFELRFRVPSVSVKSLSMTRSSAMTSVFSSPPELFRVML